jgi:aspartyl-tRNA synthetase
MMKWKTIDCGVLRPQHVGQTVVLNGWVQRRRDLGGVVFVDVRDRSGIVQVVFSEVIGAHALHLAERIRNEYVIAVEGTVVLRDAETVNPHIDTGDIEVRAQHIDVLSTAKTPPFFVEDFIEVDEALRLKHRYIDLRRPEMQRTLMMRAQAARICRETLDAHGFLEIETPILTKSTPEGARDYLVPSRVQTGSFFALPQSPQLYKQLLMVGGLEKYYQIARCFRDEDLRADRQPEFTQIDIETSFVPQERLMSWIETLIVRLFSECAGVALPTPFRKLTYAEAVGTYGSDKPDLRFGLPLTDVTDIINGARIHVFASVLEGGGVIKALVAPGCASWSRKELDELIALATKNGAKGLAYLVVAEDGWKGPLAKFFAEDQQRALQDRVGASIGDVILLSADKPAVVHHVLGLLRLHLGTKLGLIDASQHACAWVVDFPLLHWDADARRWAAEHHPFTRPKDEHIALLDTDPGAVCAQAVDLVIDGYEIGGGSMRIFERTLQEKMFSLLGFSPEQAREQFGFLLDAFEYGTPPHGGIALGFDRLMMLLAKRTNLRETIAFPKTANAFDALCGAPAPVDDAQLRALAVRIVADERK